MQPVLLLCVVIAVLGTFSNGERVGNHLSFGNSAFGVIRGGAREGKPSTRNSVKKRSVRRSVIDEDDQDDDQESHEDDEDESSSRKSSRSKSPLKKQKHFASKGQRAKKGSKSNKKGMLSIAWGSSKGSGGKKKKNSVGFSSIKDRIEGIAKTGQAAYKDLYRKAKVLRSSAFEGILLKATWPGNEPVPSELLSEIVKYSIPSFKYARSDSDDDPYYMTLHKLWTKMCEKDWRTVTKSLYILHCISRDSSSEACSNFAAALKDLSKTRNPKTPDHKYYDLKRLTSDLDDASVTFDSFIVSYGSFVIQRAKFFSGKFEELKSISTKSPEKKVIALLKKAEALIKTGLECDVDKKDRNIITGQAIRLVAMDLKDVWQLYSDKLSPWLTKEGTPYSDSKENSDDVKHVLNFFKEYDSKIREYISTQSKAFAKLRVKIPSGLDEGSNAVSLDAVTVRLEELSKLSGGASGSNSRRKHPSDTLRSINEEDDVDNDVDDDEDDDDEDLYEDEGEYVDIDEEDDEDEDKEEDVDEHEEEDQDEKHGENDDEMDDDLYGDEDDDYDDE